MRTAKDIIKTLPVGNDAQTVQKRLTLIRDSAVLNYDAATREELAIQLALRLSRVAALFSGSTEAVAYALDVSPEDIKRIGG